MSFEVLMVEQQLRLPLRAHKNPVTENEWEGILQKELPEGVRWLLTEIRKHGYYTAGHPTKYRLVEEANRWFNHGMNLNFRVRSSRTGQYRLVAVLNIPNIKQNPA